MYILRFGRNNTVKTRIVISVRIIIYEIPNSTMCRITKGITYIIRGRVGRWQRTRTTVSQESLMLSPVSRTIGMTYYRFRVAGREAHDISTVFNSALSRRERKSRKSRPFSHAGGASRRSNPRERAPSQPARMYPDAGPRSRPICERGRFTFARRLEK